MANRLITAVASVAVIFGTMTAFAQEPSPLQTTADPTLADPAAQEPGAGRDGTFFDRLKAKGEEIADETQIVERLNGEIDGWYPRLGRMTRGSGFALGPGYRFHAFDERILVDVSAGISFKGYKAADANIRWFEGLGDRLELWTDFHYEDFPQEDFFGTGAASRVEDRTSYDLDGNDISGRAVLIPATWLHLEGRIGYARPDIGPGTDDKYPSIEQLFTDVEAPGLIDQPHFVHTTFSGEIRYLDRPGNPSSGGLYRASMGFWNDRTLNEFDHVGSPGTELEFAL